MKTSSIKKNGFALPYSMAMVLLAAIIGGVIFKYIEISKSRSLQSIEENSVAIYVSSAAETFLPALDLAESRYLEEVFNCNTAREFTEALLRGHNCTGLGGISIFDSNDVKVFDKIEQTLFDYGKSSWRLNQNSVTAPTDNFIVRIPINSLFSVEFYLDASLPEKAWLLMNAVVLKNNTAIYNRKVSFSLLRQDYMIHVESSNNTISQEIQNPQNPCLNGEWMSFLTGSACNELDQVGGIVGIAYYQEKYFGLRRYNGEVVDLNNPTSMANNVIAEDGKLNGTLTFIPYKQDVLLNASDIEVIDEDSGSPQLYFIKGQASDIHIGYLNVTAGSDISVCNLGAMNWGQTYTALGVSSGSSKLIPTSGSPSVSIANFTLKSDTGDFFKVRVRSQRSSSTFTAGLPPEAIIFEPTYNRYFICTVQKSTLIETPEYKRTLGMTQSVQNFKRFSLL